MEEANHMKNRVARVPNAVSEAKKHAELSGRAQKIHQQSRKMGSFAG